jgi:hypothetical protein
MERCTSRSILRAPLPQSCLDLTIGTGWWADMRTAQARLMDFSLSRQTNFSLSIIRDRPLHRSTESMTKGSSVAVTSMLPALLTDSWRPSEAHRRHRQRARKRRRSIPGRWSLHSTRRPRRGEIQSRRAELSIGPLRGAFCGTRAWTAAPACRVIRAHDCVRSEEPNALRDGRQRGNKENSIGEGAHPLILCGRVKFSKKFLALLAIRTRFFYNAKARSVCFF